MAPGCYSPSSTKESSSNHPKSIVPNEPTTNESNLNRTINDSEDVYSILKTSSSTTSSDLIISKETAESTNNLEKSMALECYAGEINLDQIPLPSTPPPPHNMLLLHGEEDEEDDHEAEEDEQDESTDESEDEENEEEEEEEDDDEADEEEEIKKNEVDTFEILEQTIIKQKRLAKLKNTDLRRKVLLKRTFDRVLEIMDAENGFNDNDDLELTPSTTVCTTTNVASTKQSKKSIDETEKSLNVVVLEQQQSIDSFELELHPDPSSPMDDSDDEEESDDSKHQDEIISITSTTTTTTSQSTTLVKLVDMPTSSSSVVDLESSTALVPRQVKRRSSASDDEEDEDEDEDDDDDEDDRNDQSALDETCFYEYSLSHLINDQQLNYRRSKLDRHDRRPSKASDELNLYCSSVDLQVVNEQANSVSLQRRSNHPRKKLRAT